MTLDQLPTEIDYAMTAPTPMIVILASVIAAIILFGLLIVAMHKVQTWIQVTVFIGVVASLLTSMLSLQGYYEGHARFRAEAVSQHLEQTYGIDVGFTENGVPPGGLDGRTVHDGGSVYRIAVATDGSILLVDEGGKEVPRVTQ